MGLVFGLILANNLPGQLTHVMVMVHAVLDLRTLDALKLGVVLVRTTELQICLRRCTVLAQTVVTILTKITA